MQIFLQYCYSAILNIELHYREYCKKIIIFYLTLSPLFLISRLCLSSLTLSPLSLISRLCLSSLTLSPLSLISHPCLSIAEPSTHNPAPYHAIEHGENQHNNPQPMIHDPRSTTGAVRVQACHGANEILGFSEVELWNLGFFVCGFCWLMHFRLIYLVLGVWVDGLLLDYFITSPEMKASVKVTDGRGLKMQERREMWENI